MSLLVLGKNATLEIGDVGGRLTSVTGIASGTENIVQSQGPDARPVPGGRGVQAVSLGAHTVHDFRWATDSNPAHDPLLRDANGRRKQFRFRPEGEGAGKPQVVGQAVLRVTLTLDLATDAATWAVDMAVDGTPTPSVQ